MASSGNVEWRAHLHDGQRPAKILEQVSKVLLEERATPVLSFIYCEDYFRNSGAQVAPGVAGPAQTAL